MSCIIVQSLNCVWLFATPWIAAHQSSLFFHYLQEFAQTHVHWVDDAIQPSHPLSPSSPLVLSLSQHQGLSNELAVCITWPKYWSFSFIISQFSRSVISSSLQPHGLLHASLPCSSPTPRTCSNSCPSSWWCHPIISSSVVPFSFCFQSFPASGSFPVSQLFASGGLSIGVSALASVLPMKFRTDFP